MSRSFLTSFLLLTAAAWMLLSCGKSPSGTSSKTRQYDLSRSTALLDAGEALLRENASWEGIAQTPLLGTELTAILRDETQRAELFRAADALLQQERFHDLAALIDSAEKRGEATPALLELRGLPQALQALSLFCARRPYQNSRDLEESLNFLSPWCAELSRLAPETFPPFLDSQNTLLADLKHREAVQRVAELEAEIARGLTTKSAGYEPTEWLFGKIAELLPEAEILRYLAKDGTPLQGEEWIADGSWSQSKEIAAWLSWDTLTTPQRALLKSRLESAGTSRSLVGDLLLARLEESPARYVEALRRWQQERPASEISSAVPAFLEEAMKLLHSSPRTDRLHALPDYGEVIREFLP